MGEFKDLIDIDKKEVMKNWLIEKASNLVALLFSVFFMCLPFFVGMFTNYKHFEYYVFYYATFAFVLHLAYLSSKMKGKS